MKAVNENRASSMFGPLDFLLSEKQGLTPHLQLSDMPINKGALGYQTP